MPQRHLIAVVFTALVLLRTARGLSGTEAAAMLADGSWPMPLSGQALWRHAACRLVEFIRHAFIANVGALFWGSCGALLEATGVDGLFQREVRPHRDPEVRGEGVSPTSQTSTESSRTPCMTVPLCTSAR